MIKEIRCTYTTFQSVHGLIILGLGIYIHQALIGFCILFYGLCSLSHWILLACIDFFLCDQWIQKSSQDIAVPCGKPISSWLRHNFLVSLHLLCSVWKCESYGDSLKYCQAINFDCIDLATISTSPKQLHPILETAASVEALNSPGSPSSLRCGAAEWSRLASFGDAKRPSREFRWLHTDLIRT